MANLRSTIGNLYLLHDDDVHRPSLDDVVGRVAHLQETIVWWVVRVPCYGAQRELIRVHHVPNNRTGLPRAGFLGRHALDEHPAFLEGR